MAIETATQLKAHFQTGDKPTQQQFENLIDSTTNTLITGAVTVNSSNVATVVTNANLTGDVTSSGNTTTIVANAIETSMIEDLAVTNAKLAKIVISTPTFTANDYTLVLTDDGKCLNLSNGAVAGTLTIPTNASVAFPIGTQIVLRQTGSGAITFTPVSIDVTIQSLDGLLVFSGQYAGATLIKTATDTWALFGNLG